MREAAMQRHRILVDFWYIPGAERDAAWLRHVEIVKRVYGR
jgi:hypothetical protein